jgi:hypothetical protein
MTKRTNVKARAIRRNEQRALAKPKLTIVPKMARKEEKRRTGLEWLLNKNQITTDECRAGVRFGRDYRQAQVAGLEPIKSCISGDAGGSSSGSRVLASHAEANYAASQALQLAAHAIGEEEMLTACVMICGRQLTPREIEPEQRKTERLTNTLRIALRLLIRHYREQDGLTVRNIPSIPTANAI